jgi:hypothetical protein
MGLLKSLMSAAEDGPETEPATPEEARRSALEAELDRVIAERASQNSSKPSNGFPNQARPATPPFSDERRSGEERRQDADSRSSDELERRSGLERRAEPPAGRGLGRPQGKPAGFGRRSTRPQG